VTVFERCIFDRCKFFKVTFFMPKAQYLAMKGQFPSGTPGHIGRHGGDPLNPPPSVTTAVLPMARLGFLVGADYLTARGSPASMPRSCIKSSFLSSTRGAEYKRSINRQAGTTTICPGVQLNRPFSPSEA